MIQRIQTIWLILAAAAAFLTLKLSFFSGNMVTADKTKTFQYLTVTSNLILLIITIVLATTALISIFLYKNRKLQMRICLGAMLLAILNIALYYNQAQHFAEGNYDLTALVSLAIPLFFLLAARGIYKDQRLIKSLDRLR